MLREKSTARHEDRITASFSSSGNDNHESLGADQAEVPEAHASTHHNTASSSAMLQRKGRSFHSMIHLPTSTWRSGRTTFQCNFFLLSQQHV
jgi:hypothetical protein